MCTREEQIALCRIVRQVDWSKFSKLQELELYYPIMEVLGGLDIFSSLQLKVLLSVVERD